ncbi:MAG: hypothetical protein AAF502_21575 [Bacteroidota bacterium]
MKSTTPKSKSSDQHQSNRVSPNQPFFKKEREESFFSFAAESETSFFNPATIQLKPEKGSQETSTPLLSTPISKVTASGGRMIQAFTGDQVREAVITNAGIPNVTSVSSSADALTVIQAWGMNLSDIVSRLGSLSQSVAGAVTGRHAATSVAQQQQQLVNALNTTGQQTYTQVLQSLRQEPFWDAYLNNPAHEIHFFPDITGGNRYRGYTQTGTATNPDGSTHPVYIIHISKTDLEAGLNQNVLTNMIHELSHTMFNSQIDTHLRPLNQNLAEQLVDHAQIAALRAQAADPAALRSRQISLIRQLLYERTGYLEEEIFVHLQQLSSQPSVNVGGQSVPAHRYILAIVEGYLDQLKTIGLPLQYLVQALDSLNTRTVQVYDQRIASLPSGSTERRTMELNKRQAVLALRLARSLTNTN